MSEAVNETLAELYLRECGGSAYEFRYNLSQGQRVGQAFFNALSGTDQEFIRGSKYDMFALDHENARIRIEQAITWLLDNTTTEGTTV